MTNKKPINYKCTVPGCGASFRDPRWLNIHLWKYHGIDVEDTWERKEWADVSKEAISGNE